MLSTVVSALFMEFNCVCTTMSSDRSAVLYPRSDAEGLGLWLENNYHMSMLFRYDGPIVSRRVVASIDSGFLCAYRLTSILRVGGGGRYITYHYLTSPFL
jgi:hypothetical protein